MSLFPSIQPQAEPAAVLPLAREAAWDFETDLPVFVGGDAEIITGREAVKVWAWNAIKTERRRYPIFTWDYGHDLEALIGQPYTDSVKTMEAQRYLRECLMICPYITDVTDITVSFLETRLTIDCTIKTIYGDIWIEGW